MIEQRLAIPREVIAKFCERNHIRKLSLFGSVLRDDFRPDSDIDVLVEFEAGHVPGLFGMGGMQMELTEMLGRDVGFLTKEFISSRFRQKVIDSAVVIYERS